MDIDKEIIKIKEDISEIRVSVAKLSGESRIAPLIVKWLAFPLISILGACYGVSLFTGG